jgi:ketosteroid isomerase-like protein
MIEKRFASPQDAERAFYEAFERADLGAMMATWAEDEDIVCVHPGGPRRCGIVEVRESWRQIFAQGQQLKFKLAGEKRYPGRLLSVHSVYEQVSVAGDARPAATVLATNIYVLTDRGWRMLMHHASAPAGDAIPDDSPPSILH